MKRKITSEERSILLKNSELVMFDPYNALKTHRCSLGRARARIIKRHARGRLLTR